MPVKKITTPNDDDNNNNQQKLIKNNVKKIWTHFKTTPLMSPYHVTFSISDVVNVQSSEKLLSIWSENDKNNDNNNNSSIKSLLLMESLKMSDQVLKLFEGYTKISYMLPKIDIITFPTLDKTENWGVIYFWEESIFKKSEFLLEDKEKISSVIVPAIAQQWFDNLVTPHWWSDLWITSGLSTYLGYFATAKVLNIPSLVDFYLIKKIHDVPLNRDIKNCNEYIMEDITLSNKPAKIMHMLNSLITNRVFQTGVRNILQKFKFKSIKSDDFWFIMQESLNKSSLSNKINIKIVMERYVLQTGYPIINMYRNYTTGTIKLTQECSLDFKNIINNNDTYNNNNNNIKKKWWIPINFATSESFNFMSIFATHWLKPDENELTIEGVHLNDFIIFDNQVTGFYRVNYDKRSWIKISDYLNSEKFHKIHFLNRAKLLQDVTWFWQNNKMETNFFLTFVSYLKRESNVIPWFQFHDILSFAFKIDDTIFQNLVELLVNSVLEKRIFDNEKNDEFLVKKLLYMAKYWKEKFKFYSSRKN
ncbi:aminopeptidase N-like [Leptopilina boulardi]|uniref:aminopeptidase N-like n=1 Tax=Leptopilina boulardi TaxID=63433 RepID=UPI0021F5800E|nr:aminopeptidase N-like [Leptopilina boulardi]